MNSTGCSDIQRDGQKSGYRLVVPIPGYQERRTARTMQARKRLTLFLVMILIAPALQSAQSAADGWVWVGEGIEYQKFHNSDPNNIFVARMDRSNFNTTLESSIAQGKLASGTETVRGMAARYDQAINYWGQTWGNTNQVVAAINGFFFDRQSGTPWSGQIQSSWHAQRFPDGDGGSGFVWQLDREAFIGECVYYPPERQLVTFSSGATLKINGINVPRGDDELVIYTPQYDRDTNTSSSDTAVEVVVELTRPALILPNNSSQTMVTGIVRDIRYGQGSTPIPFDHIVISAEGTARDILLQNIKDNDEIGINQEIANCPSSPEKFDWTKSYASIGGDKLFLVNGSTIDFSDGESAAPAPRTAIAFNDSYVFFIVVDGYNPGVSVGMGINQVADFAKNKLGATWGISQDSGSSSTMVINGEVVNDTYCNYLFNCNKLSDVEANLPPSLIEKWSQAPEWDTSSGDWEPKVGNGMMMVVVKPKIQIGSYRPDDIITTTEDTEVRLGPGTNYAVLNTVPANTQGVILKPVSDLNGVWATGTYWWKVKFGPTKGWISLQPQFAFQSYVPFVNQGISASQLGKTILGIGAPGSR